VSVRLELADLVAATGGRLAVPVGWVPPSSVTGVATDSRLAEPGDVFVALRGPRTDGHRFVTQAMERGAVLAVVSDASAAAGPALVVPDTLRALGAIAGAHRRSLPVTVVGVTGSVGKTTTVALCAYVLETRYRTARSAESWNAEIGVALTLLGLREAHQVAVVEMAMRGEGQIRELVAIARPHLGVVTNIGDVHLELLGSRDRIAAAKAELLEGLPADGTAIVNADDPYAPRLLARARCRTIRFGTGPDADVRASDVAGDAEGSTFTLHVGGAAVPARLPLVGTHQVHNALAAAATGWALGLDAEAIAVGLGRARPVKMRQTVVTAGDLLVLDDTYNAGPQSMAAAFEVLVRVAGTRRRVLALGEMLELGAASPAFHREAGRQAAALRPAYLLAVGPHARWYLDGAAAAGLAPGAMAWVPTAPEATAVLRSVLRPGDAVLVKGSRGIEMEHLVEALSACSPADHR
jgi:UDP-N-acetylmuramoyl-tripeptide--D-alanyl-D-alanine ligase